MSKNVLPIAALVFVLGACAESGNNTGSSAAGTFLKSPALKVSVIDEFGLLTKGIDPSLPFLLSERGVNGTVKAQNKAPVEFDCQKLKMGAHGTALLWNPKGFAKGQRIALSQIAHAGYFATLDRAIEWLSEVSRDGGLNAILCQGGKSYELNLATTTYERFDDKRVIFQTTRKEGLGYKSNIRVVAEFKWGGVESKFGTKERTIEFYGLEKLSLDEDAGNAESWVFGPSPSNEAVIKKNLLAYLSKNKGPGDEKTKDDLEEVNVPVAKCSADVALKLEVSLKADLAKAFGRLDVSSESSVDFEVRRHGVLVEKKTKETTWRVGVGAQYFRENFDIAQDGRYTVIVTPKLPQIADEQVGDFLENPASESIALASSETGSSAKFKSSSFDFVIRNNGTGMGCTLELSPFSSAEKNGVTVTLASK